MSITTFFPSSHGSISYLDSTQPCRELTYSEIQLATGNFDESLVVGRGGFGKVYKGTITNGVNILTVAIKRLDSTSNQGALEFWAEVKILSKLRHSHLVSLIGYCNEQREMILIYEYMPHGTLEDHLHKHLSSLLWVRRLKICIGAARGLDYLHTGTGIKHGIIHRDVKSSNILLDENWAAKISDFGLSKIGPTNQPSTFVSTMVKGTFGYLDPDYYSTGRLTRKSDVYAFGVVLFEILCGKRAVDRSLDEEQWGLASWAQDSIKEGRLKQIVDSNIRGRISPKCLKKFAQLADRCLHSHPKKRPTMAEVVVGLESVLALQEKANKTLRTSSVTIFGHKVPTFVFPYNWETSDGDASLKSLELYLDTIQGENKIFRRFEFHTINIATDNFSEANKVSHNRFNSMYKGTLQNGKDIAIAETYSNNPYKKRYYMHEASILVKLEHENLAKLLGYCIEGTKLFLIYEFALHASLDTLIVDPLCTLLDWNKRGCMAAEYVTTSHLSTTDDVFSFGVLLLEILSGQSTFDQISKTKNLYEYVWKNWLEGTSSNVIDPRIDVDSSLMTKFVEIGLLCVQPNPADRPTMEEVVGMLLGNSSLTLPVSKMRARMIRMRSRCISAPDYDYDTSAIEESISDLYPR